MSLSALKAQETFKVSSNGRYYNGKAIVAYHSCGSQSSKEALPDAFGLTLNWTYAYTPAYKFESIPRYP